MTSESPTPGGGPRPLFDLGGLLDSLYRLYLQISHRLLDGRLEFNDTPTSPRDVNIGSKLDRRLADVAAVAGEQDGDKSAAAVGAASAARPVPQRPEGRVGGLRGMLVRGFRRRPVTRSQQHLGEKMQASTWEHINKAHLAARQGKLETARMHAGLAQNAMETASRYMRDEEYEAFKTDVEARIHSIEAG
jgi:hypothetical protein